MANPARTALGALTAAALAIGGASLAAPAEASAVPARSDSPAVAVRASAPLAARGTSARVKARWHTVNLVLVRSPSGRKDRTTMKDLKRGVRQTDAYYSRVTGGKVRFKVGRTHRWARTSAACTPLLGGRLANRYHWRPTVRTHVVAYQAVECGFAGIGEQPGRLVLMARHSSTATMVHELGHNLGLGHSNSTRCSRAFGTACSVGKDSRRTVEYGDGTDVMGGGDAGGGTKGFVPVDVPGTLGPVHLRTLGVPVPDTRISPASLSAPRTVTLRPRTTFGYNTVSFRWAERRVWLSFDPGTPGPVYPGGHGRYQPPVAPQVLVQAAGRYAASLLLPHGSQSMTGAGLPGGSLSVLPGGVRLQVVVVPGGAELTFLPA